MRNKIKDLLLLLCAGGLVLLLVVLFSHDEPIEISVPQLAKIDPAVQEAHQQAVSREEAIRARYARLSRCKINDDCIIVDKDPCGCLIGPKGVTAINALYTLEFNNTQAGTVTKTCPEQAPRAVRECSPSARAVCVQNSCKIKY